MTSQNMIFVVCLALVTTTTFGCKLLGCPDKLQNYLTMYGYLDPMKPCTSEDLKAGLRKFQELNINFNGIHVTSECDVNTTKVMNMPRCGCEDIVKGDKKKMMPQNLYSGPQAYTTFGSKWSKKTLTWKVTKYPIRNTQLTIQQVDDAMRRGLDIWAQKSTLSFKQETGSAKVDIAISFEIRRHTSQPPFYDFDGRGNVLAHAFSPESGLVHFDDDEQFTLGNDQGTELYIVAAHEFGHTLGLSHSNNQEALMAPYYRYSTNLQLHSDDIAGIQSLYGRPEQPRPATTLAPTRPPRPTEPPVVPDECKVNIKGSFKIEDVIYIFSRERVNNMRTKTFVYKVNSAGLDRSSRTPIENLFVRSGSRTNPRPYPYRVDAASYIPKRRYVFLFSGTRAYRYNYNGQKFILDEANGFPKWMDVTEFPERPRAAVAMPYYNYNDYYMLIFGTTMVWDWNFFSERVGAWAYPINVFGRNMPLRVNGAFLDSQNEVKFLKGDKYYRFSLRYRRVLEGEENVKDINKDLLKCM